MRPTVDAHEDKGPDEQNIHERHLVCFPADEKYEERTEEEPKSQQRTQQTRHEFLGQRANIIQVFSPRAMGRVRFLTERRLVCNGGFHPAALFAAAAGGFTARIYSKSQKQRSTTAGNTQRRSARRKAEAPASATRPPMASAVTT